MAVHPSSDRRGHHQLLRLVDNYADEELMRERAIEELRTKRIDLAAEYEAASAEFEQLKENTIAAEVEARELHVELETLVATVNFKQEILSSHQQAISTTNSLLKKLQDENKCMRDSFIENMMELNTKVRKMRSGANSGGPVQLDDESARGVLADLDNSEKCLELDVTKTPCTVLEEGVRNENLTELRKIGPDEARLMTTRKNLDNKQQELQHSREEEEAYMESIGQATRDLASTRKQSEDLEDLLESLTDGLQDRYVCPQCGTDNIDQCSLSLEVNDSALDICKGLQDTYTANGCKL